MADEQISTANLNMTSGGDETDVAVHSKGNSLKVVFWLMFYSE